MRLKCTEDPKKIQVLTQQAIENRTKTLQPNEYSDDRKRALREAEEDKQRREVMGL